MVQRKTVENKSTRQKTICQGPTPAQRPGNHRSPAEQAPGPPSSGKRAGNPARPTQRTAHDPHRPAEGRPGRQREQRQAQRYRKHTTKPPRFPQQPLEIKRCCMFWGTTFYAVSALLIFRVFWFCAKLPYSESALFETRIYLIY